MLGLLPCHRRDPQLQSYSPGPSAPDPSSPLQHCVLASPLCSVVCSWPRFLPYSSPAESLLGFQDVWLSCHHLDVLLHPGAGGVIPEFTWHAYRCTVVVLRILSPRWELPKGKVIPVLVSLRPRTVRGPPWARNTCGLAHCLCLAAGLGNALRSTAVCSYILVA